MSMSCKSLSPQSRCKKIIINPNDLINPSLRHEITHISLEVTTHNPRPKKKVKEKKRNPYPAWVPHPAMTINSNDFTSPFVYDLTTSFSKKNTHTNVSRLVYCHSINDSFDISLIHFKEGPPPKNQLIKPRFLFHTHSHDQLKSQRRYFLGNDASHGGKQPNSIADFHPSI
jgi:hypothetical protein